MRKRFLLLPGKKRKGRLLRKKSHRFVSRGRIWNDLRRSREPLTPIETEAYDESRRCGVIHEIIRKSCGDPPSERGCAIAGDDAGVVAREGSGDLKRLIYRRVASRGASPHYRSCIPE